MGYDENRLSLIRRIDFAWAIEKDDKKKQKKSSKETTTPWQWQSMVENLQLAQQELTVILDLIHTVSLSRNTNIFFKKKKRMVFLWLIRSSSHIIQFEISFSAVNLV